MVAKRLLVFGGLVGFGILIGLYSGHKKNSLYQFVASTFSKLEAFQKTDSIADCNFSLKHFEVSVDGKTDYFCFDKNPGSKNLIINLHTWSSNSSIGGDKFLLEYAQNRGADFVLPNLGGHNRHSDACGSEWSIRNLDRVIGKIKGMDEVEYETVIVVGGSGGGFTALNHMLRGAHSADHYISINPITSLETWFHQSRSQGRTYAEDIVECTGGLEFADKRSPMSYVKNITKFQGDFFLYHGILDGYKGSVSAIHSVRFWNAVHPASQIPGNQILKILSLDTPYVEPPFRELFTFTSRLGEFVVFNGGHEVPKNLIIERLDHLLQ